MTRGIVGRHGLWAGLVALLIAPVALADEDRTPRPPPFSSEGDISYVADMASFVGEAGKTQAEVYVAVPNDEMTFHEGKGEDGWAGDVQFQVVLRDTTGDEAFHAETDLTPRAKTRLDATDHAILQMIRERALVVPGRYRLEVTVTDRRATKPGLLDRIRKVKSRGSVEAWIDVPRLSSDSLTLSDLVLVRDARVAEENDAWARRGVDFDPNPSRFYGLALPQVRCFAEVSTGRDWQEGDTYLVQLQVMEPGGAPLLERTSRAAPKGRDFGVTDEQALEKEVSAGTYQLVMTVMNERSHEIARSERPFEVVWSVASWGREPDDELQEMILIMSDAEYRTLENLRPGAREVYLAEFWHGLDPDPNTPENPVLDEFRTRIAYADHEFGTPVRRGILTDRGRVYVRYGPPDDEQYDYSSSNFGGAAGEVEKVAEPGERVQIGSRPAASFLDAAEFREGDQSDLAEQRGGTTVKAQQLLTWNYDGRGSPLRADRQELSSESHRGLKFVFSDPMGNGDFQLLGSSGTTLY